jgi:hypothetical protein
MCEGFSGEEVLNFLCSYLLLIHNCRIMEDELSLKNWSKLDCPFAAIVFKMMLLHQYFWMWYAH